MKQPRHNACSLADATDTVNSLPTDRHGPWWRHAFEVDNDTSVTYTQAVITVVQSNLYSSVTGHVFVAETRDDLPTGVPRARVKYAYDHQGRMVWKEIKRRDAETQSWETEKAAALFWDGYNIVQATIENQQSTITNHFVWGLDLSGSLQGAGGVGGLLAEVQDGEPYFAAFDANGNVTQYLSTNGTLAAHYEYSPFGEIVVESSQSAINNPQSAISFTHRFSTKPWCAVTGLSEYEKRKYGPGMGRWLNRDPIGEKGGYNYYILGANDPLTQVDPLGMDSFDFRGGSVTFKPSWDIWPQWHTGATLADSLTAAMVVDSKSSVCAGNASGCCVELFKDTVDMTGRWWAYWWVIGAGGHEAFHVGRFRTEAWLKLADYARSKEGCYKTSAAASCWKATIENEAAAYYLALGWLKSHELDEGEKNYSTRHAVFQSAYDIAKNALMAKEATCTEVMCAD